MWLAEADRGAKTNCADTDVKVIYRNLHLLSNLYNKVSEYRIFRTQIRLTKRELKQQRFNEIANIEEKLSHNTFK